MKESMPENPSNGKFPQNDQCKLRSIIYSQTRSTFNIQSKVRLYLGRKWLLKRFTSLSTGRRYLAKNFLLFKTTKWLSGCQTDNRPFSSKPVNAFILSWWKSWDRMSKEDRFRCHPECIHVSKKFSIFNSRFSISDFRFFPKSGERIY